eukprot:9008922-Lingulodinium_polyedra.AAC.1
MGQARSQSSAATAKSTLMRPSSRAKPGNHPASSARRRNAGHSTPTAPWRGGVVLGRVVPPILGG